MIVYKLAMCALVLVLLAAAWARADEGRPAQPHLTEAWMVGEAARACIDAPDPQSYRKAEVLALALYLDKTLAGLAVLPAERDAYVLFNACRQAFSAR